MNDDAAIKVAHISKAFKLPHEKQNSVKGLLINRFKNGKNTFEKQTVLQDISFEIKKGDFFGVVGRNGSGKSTLLKLLAGIYTPNAGSIEVVGKLTPFIELGVGFNPELTGRENVFLNGALLGFNRSEMTSMYDKIVAFAELDRFMDQKLKNYSSGMQVRLAFSIAIRANTDILILDEVLAVGDEAFQRKCFSYFEQLKRNKKTVVLVTHDMAAVERYCNTAILIENGKIIQQGNPRMVAAAYSRSNSESLSVEEEATTEPEKKPEEAIKPKPRSDIHIQIVDAEGKPCRKFTQGQTLYVKMAWSKPNVRFVGVAIMRQSGEYVFGPNTYQDKLELNGRMDITYKVTLNLGEGEYFLKAGIFGKNDADIIDFQEEGPRFIVNRDYQRHRWGGMTELDYQWE